MRAKRYPEGAGAVSDLLPDPPLCFRIVASSQALPTLLSAADPGFHLKSLLLTLPPNG